MADAATMLMGNSYINEFLGILKEAGRRNQANEYTEFFNSVDSMQGQLNETLAELRNVRKQLESIQNRKNPIKKAFTAIVDKLQEEIKLMQEELNAIKEKLIDGAKNAVRSFKEHGIAALNGILKLFRVNKELKAAIDRSAATIESCNKSIAKIEAISNEYHAMGTHTRNIRAALFGKEMPVQEQKDNGRLSKALQGLVRFRKKLAEGMKKRCEDSLVKMENLDKTVQMNRTNAVKRKASKKPSIIGEIENYQAPARTALAKDRKKEEVSI